MSQTIRAYLPATLTQLAELRETGELAATWSAYAVTPALRDQLGDRDAGFARQHRDRDLGFARQHRDRVAGFARQHRDRDAGFARERRDTDQDELLSYAAFRLAADASVRLLRDDPAAPRRRVVISADAAAEPEAAGGRVRLTGRLALASVAAIHVDGAAAEPEVAAAAASDDPAVDQELEWYDVSELPQLLELLA